MQTITINIQNDTLVDKVVWLLEHFKNDGVEITSREDIDDLKLLKTTKMVKNSTLFLPINIK